MFRDGMSQTDPFKRLNLVKFSEQRSATLATNTLSSKSEAAAAKKSVAIKQIPHKEGFRHPSCG